MPANTAPIFPRQPDIAWATLTAANTAKDGTGTVATVFTADATNGSRIDYLRIKPLGTNVASVLRVFINNGSTNATAANNSMIEDITLPATTNSEAAQLSAIILNLDLSLPAGYKINVVLGTAIAAGVAVTACGGDY